MVRGSLVQAWAQAIWAKVSVAQTELDARELRRLRESISDDIRKCTDLATPLVSQAARAEAESQGMIDDLTGKGWHDQPRFDKGRLLFHWDHVTTVSEIRRRCLKSKSVAAIEKHLKAAQVAWILKSENRTLTDLGYRSKRPPQAYRDAGIILT